MKRLFFLFAFVFLMFSTVEVQAASCDDDVGYTIENLSVTIDLVATQLSLPGKEIFVSSRYAEVISTLDARYFEVFIKLDNSQKVSRKINTQYFMSYLRDNNEEVPTNLTKLQDQNNTYYVSYLRNC